MANIESQLTTIKSAAGGEDVREAIIGALRNINNDVPADMSNPVQIKEDMPLNSDLTIPLNPPKLVSQIYIKQAGSGGKSTRLVEATITENGTYPTADKDDGGGSYDPDKENRYYSKVTVKVPQLANAIEMETVEITQNGLYDATEWGVDGLRSINVNVSGATGDGPFQVDFYDKPQTDPTAKAIYTELVPKGGSAEFKGTKPTSSIGPLTGWNPTPINVTRDMKCYPQFGQIIVDPTDILDDWDVICAKGGQGYPIGSHKVLAYGATFSAAEVKTWNPDYSGGDIAYNQYMMMYKVGEGEGNSHSSWLSTWISLDSLSFANYDDWTDDNCDMRKFLQVFYNHMADIFKNTIIPVTKYSSNVSNVLVPTQDTLWIPNSIEIGTYQTGLSEWGQYDFGNGSNWEGAYPETIYPLESESCINYVIDFFNNDRNYPMTFANNYNGSMGNQTTCMLRDAGFSRFGEGHYAYRRFYGGLQYVPNRAGESQHGINLGFCL